MEDSIDLETKNYELDDFSDELTLTLNAEDEELDYGENDDVDLNGSNENSFDPLEEAGGGNGDKDDLCETDGGNENKLEANENMEISEDKRNDLSNSEPQKGLSTSPYVKMSLKQKGTLALRRFKKDSSKIFNDAPCVNAFTNLFCNIKATDYVSWCKLFEKIGIDLPLIQIPEDEDSVIFKMKSLVDRNKFIKYSSTDPESLINVKTIIVHENNEIKPGEGKNFRVMPKEEALNILYPLMNKIYTAQLAEKKERLTEIIRRKLLPLSSIEKYYTSKQPLKTIGASRNIVPFSPIDGYENNVLIAIEKNADTGDVVHGLRVVSQDGESSTILPLEQCLSIPRQMALVSKGIVSSLVDSGFVPYCPISEEGDLLGLCLRITVNGIFILTAILRMPDQLPFHEFTPEGIVLKEGEKPDVSYRAIISQRKEEITKKLKKFFADNGKNFGLGCLWKVFLHKEFFLSHMAPDIWKTMQKPEFVIGQNLLLHVIDKIKVSVAWDRENHTEMYEKLISLLGNSFFDRKPNVYLLSPIREIGYYLAKKCAHVTQMEALPGDFFFDANLPGSDANLEYQFYNSQKRNFPSPENSIIIWWPLVNTLSERTRKEMSTAKDLLQKSKIQNMVYLSFWGRSNSEIDLHQEFLDTVNSIIKVEKIYLFDYEPYKEGCGTLITFRGRQQRIESATKEDRIMPIRKPLTISKIRKKIRAQIFISKKLSLEKLNRTGARKRGVKPAKLLPSRELKRLYGRSPEHPRFGRRGSNSPDSSFRRALGCPPRNITSRERRTPDSLSRNIPCREGRTPDSPPRIIRRREKKTPDLPPRNIACRERRTPDSPPKMIPRREKRTPDLPSRNIACRERQTTDLSLRNISTRWEKTRDSPPRNIPFSGWSRHNERSPEHLTRQQGTIYSQGQQDLFSRKRSPDLPQRNITQSEERTAYSPSRNISHREEWSRNNERSPDYYVPQQQGTHKSQDRQDQFPRNNNKTPDVTWREMPIWGWPKHDESPSQHNLPPQPSTSHSLGSFMSAGKPDMSPIKISKFTEQPRSNKPEAESPDSRQAFSTVSMMKQNSDMRGMCGTSTEKIVCDQWHNELPKPQQPGFSHSLIRQSSFTIMENSDPPPPYVPNKAFSMYTKSMPDPHGSKQSGSNISKARLKPVSFTIRKKTDLPPAYVPSSQWSEHKEPVQEQHGLQQPSAYNYLVEQDSFSGRRKPDLPPIDVLRKEWPIHTGLLHAPENTGLQHPNPSTLYDVAGGVRNLKTAPKEMEVLLNQSNWKLAAQYQPAQYQPAQRSSPSLPSKRSLPVVEYYSGIRSSRSGPEEDQNTGEPVRKSRWDCTSSQPARDLGGNYEREYYDTQAPNRRREELFERRNTYWDGLAGGQVEPKYPSQGLTKELPQSTERSAGNYPEKPTSTWRRMSSSSSNYHSLGDRKDFY